MTDVGEIRPLVRPLAARRGAGEGRRPARRSSMIDFRLRGARLESTRRFDDQLAGAREALSGLSLTNTAKAATEIRPDWRQAGRVFLLPGTSPRGEQRRFCLDSDADFGRSGDAPARGVRRAARAALRRVAAGVRARLRDLRHAQRRAIECDPGLPRAERFAPCRRHPRRRDRQAKAGGTTWSVPASRSTPTVFSSSASTISAAASARPGPRRSIRRPASPGAPIFRSSPSRTGSMRRRGSPTGWASRASPR